MYVISNKQTSGVWEVARLVNLILILQRASYLNVV